MIKEMEQYKKTYGAVLKRKYTNYNFYFLNTPYGDKEVTKIHIYENNNILLTLKNPWFGTNDVLDLQTDIFYKEKKILNQDIVFYVNSNIRKGVELYVPNSIVQLTKERVNKKNGLYTSVEVYKSGNPMFKDFKEEVTLSLDNDMILRVRELCCKARKSF